MFSEEIHSDGKFWYDKPNKFRCDYATPSPAEFYLLDGKIYFYSAENKQVDTSSVATGENAPINEMLVGFGLETERILEVFDVEALEKESDAKTLVIRFTSKDNQRTRDFNTVTIWCDREAREPRRLEMQEVEDLVKIELKTIRTNPEIDPAIFQPDFPDDVTIAEY